MKYRLPLSSLLSMIALASVPSFGQTFRMAGKVTLPDGSTPVTGFVCLLKTPTPAFSPQAAIDAQGNFDLTYNAAYSGGIPTGKLALLYYAPGQVPSTTNDPASDKRIFEFDFAAKNITVSPGSGELPFQKYYPLPGDYLTWCGLQIRKESAINRFEFDATRGWCPADYEKLNSVVSRAYPSGNLISNSSFEDNYVNHIYPHWDTDGLHSGNYAGINYPMGNLKPRSGRRAAAIQYSSNPAGPAEQAYLRSAPFQVKPNTEYLLVFYYSTKNPVGTAGVRPMVKTFSEKNGPEVFDMAFGRHGTWTYGVTGESWAQYYHPFKTGPLGVFASVELLRTNVNPTGGVFYFDDVLVVEANATQSPGASMHQVVTKATFANGMNKPIQTRSQVGNSDIFSQTQYDAFFRAVKSSLPVGGSFASQRAANGYLPDVFNRANTLYNGTGGFPNAGNVAFTETQYESSPIGRPILHASQGSAWSATSGHTNRIFFSSTVSAQTTVDKPNPPTSGAQYDYRFSQGEGTQAERTYTDKFGRVVKKESKMAVSNRWAVTEYKYDLNGNLSQVISPPGHDATRATTNMKYTNLGHLMSVSSNDVGETRHVYDNAGRLRFTKTKDQDDFNRFTYRKYDQYERIIETGEYKDKSRFTVDMANDPYFPYSGESARQIHTAQFYDRIPDMTHPCDDQDLTYIVRDDAQYEVEHVHLSDAFAGAYAEMATRSSFAGKVRFYQVFNSLAHVIEPSPGVNFTPLRLSNGTQVGYEIIGVLRGSATYREVVEKSLPFQVNWGPLQGRLVKSVSCNADLDLSMAKIKPVATYFNYDKYGNVIETYEFNGYIQDVASQWQKSEQNHDVQGRLLRKKIFANAWASSPVVTYAYTYNTLGLVDQVTDHNLAVIAKHTYNAVGQLVGLDIGQGPGQVKLAYTYHIRGWQKRIEATTPAGTRLFLQDLKYEDGPVATQRFDGNISEYDYALTHGTTPHKFSFTYGDLDRLATSTSTLRETGQTVNPTWNYTYHDNGSIKTMVKNGQTFTYNYQPGMNQLINIGFTGSYPRSFDRANNFSYDSDGRLRNDQSNPIGINYSSNDLPYRFNYYRGAVRYDLDIVTSAEGQRRSKILFKDANLPAISAKHYMANGKEIRETSAQATVETYPLAEYGRVVRNTAGQFEYEAYIRDHLGSTVKIHNVNLNSSVYSTDYEPYGRLRVQTSATGIPVTEKFTGKEYDEGPELSYFGARYYDPEIGMWISPDAARQHASLYTYGGNNPVNRFDPDGNSDVEAMFRWAFGYSGPNQVVAPASPHVRANSMQLVKSSVSVGMGVAATGAGIALTSSTAGTAAPFGYFLMQYGIAQSVAGMTFVGIALSNLFGGSPASLENSYRGPLAHAGGFVGGETGARLGAVGDVGVGLATLRLDIKSSGTTGELLFNAGTGGAGAVDDIDAAVTEFKR